MATHHNRAAPEGPAPRAAGVRVPAELGAGRSGGGGGAQHEPQAEAVGPGLEARRGDGGVRKEMGVGYAVAARGLAWYWVLFATIATPRGITPCRPVSRCLS